MVVPSGSEGPDSHLLSVYDISAVHHAARSADGIAYLTVGDDDEAEVWRATYPGAVLLVDSAELSRPVTATNVIVTNGRTGEELAGQVLEFLSAPDPNTARRAIAISLGAVLAEFGLRSESRLVADLSRDLDLIGDDA